MGTHVEVALGILNGVIGDYLERTGNGLATEMQLVQRGRPLPMARTALARAYPDATPRVVVLLHGSSCTELSWQMPDGTDYGALLARDLGYTPLYVRYNSGLAIADSGEALARLLETLVAEYPVPVDELLLIGHSMGGLVIRSACHVAKRQGLGWTGRVRRAIYVGTPHLGAPLERIGRVVAKILTAVDDPYTRLAADLGNLRSAGIRDLGDADLTHEDRARQCATLSLRDARHPVPLLPEIQHFLIAGSFSTDPRIALLFGDALVPVASATFGHCTDAATLGLPPSHIRFFAGVSHMRLPRSPEVYAQIRTWCEETA